MKKILLFFLMLAPFFATANNHTDNEINPKYLEGAVPLVDGIVTFHETFTVENKSKAELYQTMLQWAGNRFKPHGELSSRIAYTNEEEGEIAVVAEEYIIFSSALLSIDRTRIYYNFIIDVDDNKCELTMQRIHYWYNENRDGGLKYRAEEWIVDKYALNKKKTKLASKSGKFRKATIDLKDNLFLSAQKAMNISADDKETVQNKTNESAAAQENPGTTIAKELNKITISELPNNLSTRAINGYVTITAGNNEEVEIKADNWGGIGKASLTDVVYLLIEESRIAASALMKQYNTYTVSFYPAKGQEAEIKIECKKLKAEEVSAEKLKTINPALDASKKYTLYTGSINTIWKLE